MAPMRLKGGREIGGVLGCSHPKDQVAPGTISSNGKLPFQQLVAGMNAERALPMGLDAHSPTLACIFVQIALPLV